MSLHELSLHELSLRELGEGLRAKKMVTPSRELTRRRGLRRALPVAVSAGISA